MFPSQKIAILGYGTEGKALAAYFGAQGVHITVCDQNPYLKIPEPFQSRLGGNAFENLKGFDLIFKSPGIPPQRIGEVPTTSLTQYFFEKCPCPIIGVTGTKGKGTTSTLIYEILKAGGLDAHLGGNIGIPPLEFLDQLTPASWVVLELSSFQTQDLLRSPHIGVVLNTTSDHLDYHVDQREYHGAKAQMLKQQTPNDHTIYNADYVNCAKIARSSKGHKWTVSTRKAVRNGAQIQGKKIVVKNEGKATEIMLVADVGLLGKHNLENVLPAVTVATLLDLSPATIRKAVSKFKGLPHRLEHVTTRGGVDYYNDSFSTTPETSLAGIEAFERPVHLIAGGSEKYSDFNAWAKACVKHKKLKTIFLTGKASASRMAKALEKANRPKSKSFRKSLKIVRVETLEDAMCMAQKTATAKDVVLLSPACASFEEFPNYKVRGERFRELAR